MLTTFTSTNTVLAMTELYSSSADNTLKTNGQGCVTFPLPGDMSFISLTMIALSRMTFVHIATAPPDRLCAAYCRQVDSPACRSYWLLSSHRLVFVAFRSLPSAASNGTV